MIISIQIDRPREKQVRPWGEAMLQDSYSVYARLIDGKPVGQFSLYQVFQTRNGVYIGDMGANTTARDITHDELMYIASLQKPSDGFNLDQVMNWLMNGGSGKWNSPMRAEYPSAARWREAINIKMIAAVYAGQPIFVEEEKVFVGWAWQGKVEPSVTMSRIKVGGIQEVTAVDDEDHPILPRGHIYLPMWFKETPWIPNRWLENV